MWIIQAKNIARKELSSTFGAALTRIFHRLVFYERARKTRVCYSQSYNTPMKMQDKSRQAGSPPHFDTALW